MRSVPVLAVLLMSCSAEAPEVHPWSPPPGGQLELPPRDGSYRAPTGLLQLAVSPVVPGDLATVTVTGANPLETVHIALGTGGLGPGQCFGTLGGLCIDLLTPVQLFLTLQVDGLGEGSSVVEVPMSVPIGAGLHLQAVIPRGESGLLWDKSDPVAITVQDAPVTVADLVPGDLIITEIMHRPSAVPDGVGEWFEIVNNAPDDANLAGLLVTDSRTAFTIDRTLFVRQGERVVLAASMDPAVNGGVPADFAWPALDLDDAYGEIVLAALGVPIDVVGWDGGTSFPDVAGASMSLQVGMDAASNDLGVSWCAATWPYGDGDLGSPGVPNEICAWDRDGDGSAFPSDCDDSDPAVHPGAAEICNGIDDDCDGGTDDVAECAFVFDASSPGTFDTVEDLCHGSGGCAAGYNGGVARLDNVPPGGSGSGVKRFAGLQPSTAYAISVQVVTDEEGSSEHNTLAVTVGDVVAVADQSLGTSVVTEVPGTVVTDGSGAFSAVVQAESGVGGSGAVSSHSTWTRISGAAIGPVP